MDANPNTATERRLTTALTLALLSVESTPIELAAYLTQLFGSPEAALRLLNEATDVAYEIRQQLASVALQLSTSRTPT